MTRTTDTELTRIWHRDGARAVADTLVYLTRYGVDPNTDAHLRAAYDRLDAWDTEESVREGVRSYLPYVDR